MHAKLTLRMDEALVERAKMQAAQRGKSVSKMFGEFVASLGTSKRGCDLPPITSSLLGIIKGRCVSEKDYKKRLREKYV